MKFAITYLCLILSLPVFAQQSKEKKITKQQVKVTDWNGRSLFVGDTVWQLTHDTVISQIGINEFEKVKIYCNMYDWPEQMQHPIAKRRDSSFMAAYYNKLAKLNMYKIASYVNPIGTKKKYAILKVPYELNRNWDKNVKWDYLYFVFEEKCIRSVIESNKIFNLPQP